MDTWDYSSEFLKFKSTGDGLCSLPLHGCEHLAGSIMHKQSAFLSPAQSLAHGGKQSMFVELD